MKERRQAVDWPPASPGKQSPRHSRNPAISMISRRSSAKQERAPAPRLVIGISGASGVVYGLRLLELLKPTIIETHLIMSRTAEQTLAYETDSKVRDVRALADHVHAADDFAAPISSGSFQTMGMIV